MLALAFRFLAEDVKLLAVIQPLEQVGFTFLGCVLDIGTLSRTFCFWFLLCHDSLYERLTVSSSLQSGRQQGEVRRV